MKSKKRYTTVRRVVYQAWESLHTLPGRTCRLVLEMRAAGQPPSTRLPRGLIKGVEPTPAPPAGPTQPRPGLRDGRGCNDWHKFQPGGSHPREPPGHIRDHGPGRSAAHTHRTWRAQQPERRSGPQRRQSRRRLQQQSGPSRGSASGPAANVAVGAGPGWAVRELQGL
ncbi:hypothetical protein NDU88_002079 [Pleurodeles waltl]|uniref:Uncharacterized protein n=1 Tax=Pleurodeles waltl TaxID=8319 RepID=A0AAV7WKD4_PLEWA|nr:hypothetical protein NDU88_002079 [Pleurodeles waltl]